MFQTPAAPTTTSSSSRRSTRVSRFSSGANNDSQSTRKKSVTRRSTPKGPARKWAKVLRAPADNVGFKTLQWISIQDLNFDEKIAWDEDQMRDKGSVIMDGKTGTESGGASDEVSLKDEDNNNNNTESKMDGDNDDGSERPSKKPRIEENQPTEQKEEVGDSQASQAMDTAKAEENTSTE